MRRGLFLVIFWAGLLLLLAPKPSWQAEWDQVLQTAKKEGKVSVIGFLSREVRDVLTEPFQKQYDIPVEYLGSQGPEVPTKVATERRAGKYLWDVFVGGNEATVEELMKKGVPIAVVEPRHGLRQQPVGRGSRSHSPLEGTAAGLHQNVHARGDEGERPSSFPTPRGLRTLGSKTVKED